MGTPSLHVVGDSVHAKLLRQHADRLKVPQRESADVVWIAHEIDRYDPHPKVPAWGPAHFSSGAECVLSTPGPIGFSETYVQAKVGVTYVLENVREHDRLIDFPRPPFVRGWVNGVPTPNTDALLHLLYGGPFYETTAKEAEFIKHALNALLATCVTFSEEIKELCTDRDFSPEAVLRALRQDPRVGGNLPILPRGKFSSHLERDVRGLLALAHEGWEPLLECVLRYRAGS